MKDVAAALIPRTEKRRERGRPTSLQDPLYRDKLLTCARWRLLGGYSVSSVADAFGVAPRTVKRWTKEALKLDGPEADALLREIARKHQSHAR